MAYTINESSSEDEVEIISEKLPKIKKEKSPKKSIFQRSTTEKMDYLENRYPADSDDSKFKTINLDTERALLKETDDACTWQNDTTKKNSTTQTESKHVDSEVEGLIQKLQVSLKA